MATRGTKNTPKVNSEVMTAPSVIVMASTIARKGPATRPRQERTQHLKDKTYAAAWAIVATAMQQECDGFCTLQALPGTQR